MSYCVNCGVELSDCDTICPLCHTKVLNPNISDGKNEKPPFPKYKKAPVQKVSRRSIVELVSWLFAIPFFICIACNLTINHQISWSGYVIGALALLYILTVFPFIVLHFSRKAAPAICMFFDFMCTLCFLLYIEQATGGKWFPLFALPLTCAVFLFILIITLLGTLTKMHPLSLSALAIIFIGVFCVLTEILINLNFGARDFLIWSLYPLITTVILAVILIIIDKNTALKEKMAKKFFI